MLPAGLASQTRRMLVVACVGFAALFSKNVAAQPCTGANIALLGSPNVQFSAILWNQTPALVVVIVDSDPVVHFVRFYDPSLGFCPYSLRLEAMGALDSRECSAGARLWLTGDDLHAYSLGIMPPIPGAVFIGSGPVTIGWLSPSMNTEWSIDYAGLVSPGPCPGPPRGPKIVVAIFTVQT